MNVLSLGQEDPLEEGMATHSSILPWRIPLWTEEPGGLSPWGRKELDTTKHNNRRRQWHLTPALLPGKSHGWRSLVGCSPC